MHLRPPRGDAMSAVTRSLDAAGHILATWLTESSLVAGYQRLSQKSHSEVRTPAPGANGSANSR